MEGRGKIGEKGRIDIDREGNKYEGKVGHPYFPSSHEARSAYY